jgi:hypothetical protein
MLPLVLVLMLMVVLFETSCEITCWMNTLMP